MSEFPGATSKRLGEEYGVSHRTIERDAEFARTVVKLTDKGGEHPLGPVHAGRTDVEHLGGFGAGDWLSIN